MVNFRLKFIASKMITYSGSGKFNCFNCIININDWFLVERYRHLRLMTYLYVLNQLWYIHMDWINNQDKKTNSNPFTLANPENCWWVNSVWISSEVRIIILAAMTRMINRRMLCRCDVVFKFLSRSSFVKQVTSLTGESISSNYLHDLLVYSLSEP
jgi:hypothetical protein